MSLLSSESMFWFEEGFVLEPVACWEEAPPPSLLSLVWSMSPSGKTAARRTFLILLSSVVKVTRASFELLRSYWHLSFSIMLFSTCLRVRFE